MSENTLKPNIKNDRVFLQFLFVIFTLIVLRIYIYIKKYELTFEYALKKLQTNIGGKQYN